MPRIDFDQLPANGRLWVFPLRRRLEPAEVESVLGVVDDFLDGWAAHGMALRSGRLLLDDHFLLVGVDVDAESPSGCSIDALTGRLRNLGAELGTTFVDHSAVWYRGEGGVSVVSRQDFKRLAAAGVVDSETSVYDTTVTRVEDAGRIERPARDSWHGPAYFGG